VNLPVEYILASREYYSPLENARDERPLFAPAQVPEGWVGDSATVWTMWHRPGRAEDLVDEGWKVHVSARDGRQQLVLDRVAEVCFELAIPFKHLSSGLFYWCAHAKFANRAQSGKFIAVYPRDVESARRLMERLREALADEDGPYILSDRRYKDSRTVHYRYGSYTPFSRLRPDGTRELLVRDLDGKLVHDRRDVMFHLPEGIVDPFQEPGGGADAIAEGVSKGVAAGADIGADAEPAGDRAADPDDVAVFRGFAFESSVQYSNAGGTYRGRELATGRRVFIKEARSHVGLREDDANAVRQLREEWEVLTELHRLAPGAAPEPLAYFRVWEHEFMVTEHVEGRMLGRWVVGTHPILFGGSTPEDYASFYARAQRVLAAVEGELARIHEAGYIYGDVSPNNILMNEDDDSVRFVDFGSAQRRDGEFRFDGTPGYAPPGGKIFDDPVLHDDYGLSGIAQLLLGPLNLVFAASPAAIAYQHYDLSESAPVPAGLWERATKYRPAVLEHRLPTPQEVAAEPVRHLTDLRERVADALLAAADLEHPERVFPTIAQGYQSNTVCVAYGTAGVVHALRRAGRELPEGLLERLRRDALDKADRLAPGLYPGTAGIARVLAECGLLDEARALLAAADGHPLTGQSATLFGGAAGVAVTHLGMFGLTGDEQHVERAEALAAALPADDALVEQLGPNDAHGLMHGRTGVALMLQQLAGVTGERRHLERARRLLHAELDRASDPDAPGLLFPGSATDRRALPYLFLGTAGVVFATSRFLAAEPDERLAEALPRMLAPLRLTFTAQPGLFQGLASYAFTLADHAAISGDEEVGRAALRVARSLFKYSVPCPTGVRYLGDQLLRYSDELWSGSAGVLLALTHVLEPRPDALLTADAVIAQRGSGSGKSAAEAVIPAAASPHTTPAGPAPVLAGTR